MVTNYLPRADHVTSHFVGPGWRRLDDIAVGDTVWRVDVWQKAA